MTALRIAWRELRASRARFVFVILAVAVGVGSLTGVRGFSRAFRGMLLREARTLMAGDMTVRVFSLPSAEQQRALDDLGRQGVRHTWITETVTMASSAATPDPLLVSVKAVDPQAYPYYGVVKLAPDRPFREALDANSAVVSDDLPMRLSVRVGDAIRIGGQEFRIAGVVAAEPDRMTGSLNVGPRVMVTRAGLDRTGLIGPGSRAAERYLFRLPAGGMDIVQARAVLRSVFPEAVIADYRETHPILTRGLDRATTFLSMIGLIALIVGAMGVASAMHGHLQEKLDSIAVMKCLGARSAQVIRIYTAQTLLLGLAGGLLGAIFGIGVAAAFPGLLARYFTIDARATWDPWPAVQGIAIACLVTLLFTVPPLVSIRDIRPALVFRRDVEAGLRRRTWGRAGAIRALILLGTAGVAGTLAEGGAAAALRTGGLFAGALAGGIALLWGAGWLFLRLLRFAPKRLPGAVRHGIANLQRPGNQAQAAVVALGVGVMCTLTVFLVQEALVRQIRGSAPPGMPNVFLLDIPGSDRQAVQQLVAAQPGVTSAPDVAFAVQARITAVNGVPIERVAKGDFARRFQRPRSVTEMENKPEEMEILRGSWWTPGAEPQVCIAQETAKALGVEPGGVLDWNIWSHPIRTRVQCIERSESLRMSARFDFLFSPGPLRGMPATYYGSARVRSGDVAGLQRVMYARFPTVTVVNVADVMQIVEEVVDRISLVIRFISAFTVLAGAVMLASAIAGTRFRRMREVVILKTLGATRRRIGWIFSVEFLALGTVAGVMGTLLASGLTALVLKRLLDMEFHPDVGASAIAVALAAGIAVAAGWAASFRILGRKPLEILREE